MNRNSWRVWLSVCVLVCPLGLGCGDDDSESSRDASVRDSGNDDAGRDGSVFDAGDEDSGRDASSTSDATTDADDQDDATSGDASSVLDAGEGFVITYLSDPLWIWDDVENGWGPVERDLTNGEDQAGDGRTPFDIGGVEYTRGLGAHAPSEIVVQLDGHCRLFTADVGVDSEAGGDGDVIFEVWVDEVREYQSKLIHQGDKPTPISVELTDGDELRLVADVGDDDLSHDHADWADARITCMAGWMGAPDIEL